MHNININIGNLIEAHDGIKQLLKNLIRIDMETKPPSNNSYYLSYIECSNYLNNKREIGSITDDPSRTANILSSDFMYNETRFSISYWMQLEDKLAFIDHQFRENRRIIAEQSIIL